ncbi:RNA polymerase sigma factor [Alcanivoracaceae bacterium MT1]
MIRKLLKYKNLETEQAIFNKYYERIYSTAFFITNDPHLSQDITQDTFIKAFKNMSSLKDEQKLGAWLGTIATTTSIDYIRKSRKWNDIVAEGSYIEQELHKKLKTNSPVEKLVELKFIKETMFKAIDNLKPEHKQILLLKYEYDLKDHEIAEQLNLNIGTVKSRLYRAKEQLKEHLNKKDFKIGDIG